MEHIVEQNDLCSYAEKRNTEYCTPELVSCCETESLKNFSENRTCRIVGFKVEKKIILEHENVLDMPPIVLRRVCIAQEIEMEKFLMIEENKERRKEDCLMDNGSREMDLDLADTKDRKSI